MKKLKIALLATSFLPSKGGAEIGLSNLANLLSRKGHQVYVIIPFSNFMKLNKFRKDLNYNLIFFPPRFWYFFFNFRFFFKLLSFFYFNLINFIIKPYVYHCTNGFTLGFTMIKLNKSIKFKYLIRCTGEDIQRSEEAGYGIRLNKKFNSEKTYKVLGWQPRYTLENLWNKKIVKTPLEKAFLRAELFLNLTGISIIIFDPETILIKSI